MNNKTVTYNGKTMSLYEATQKQRGIERQIRRWKREAGAMEAGGLDASYITGKNGYLPKWQATQRDFIDQTGLRRDYFRERAGAQLSGVRSGGILNDISGGRYPVTRASISKIPTHDLGQYSGDLLRSQQAELLESLMGKPVISEASAYYSLDGRRLAGGLGLEGRAPGYRIGQPHISIHNHPSGLTFSPTDIERFINSPENIILSAVGNNGTSYVLERIPGFEAAEFVKYYAGMMMGSENLSAADYVRRMEEILKGAEKYGFRYYR